MPTNFTLGPTASTSLWRSSHIRQPLPGFYGVDVVSADSCCPETHESGEGKKAHALVVKPFSVRGVTSQIIGVLSPTRGG